MKRSYRLIPALILAFSFGCCCTQAPVAKDCGNPCGSVAYVEVKHSEFTRQSLSRIREGMTVNEFESIFGYPDRSHERTLGLTKVLIYEYDMAKDPHYPHQFDLSNTFYFGVDQKPPYLKNWEVDYVHSDVHMVPVRSAGAEVRYERVQRVNEY
jgi:hypothetical protein